jgi:hypothetical protein
MFLKTPGGMILKNDISSHISELIDLVISAAHNFPARALLMKSSIPVSHCHRRLTSAASLATTLTASCSNILVQIGPQRAGQINDVIELNDVAVGIGGLFRYVR